MSIEKDYDESEVEFDIDSDNPRKIKITISAERDMSDSDLYDALHCLVHDILEPELASKVKDCKDIAKH